MPTIANSEAAAFWDGEQGAHWAAHWQHYDRSLGAYHSRLLAAADLQPADSVLDIGCGNGQVTRDAARAAYQGAVLGLDLSSPMLARARELAAAQGLDTVRYERSDAQVHPFLPGTFDVALSRFGSMFFTDPVAAFANIGSGLRSGGRLAIVAWRPVSDNEWLSEIRGAISTEVDIPPLPAVGTPGPFGLADPDQTTATLTAAGFDLIDIAPLDLPMWVGSDVADANEHYLGAPGVAQLINVLDSERRTRLERALWQVLARHRGEDGVVFRSAGWLIRARWPGQ